MHSISDIRSKFLSFFEENGHKAVPSSPLVPHNDPTLMFTNAGMVQFKNVFTGAEKLPYSRAASSQKCVRAGGKHNDLDNVGYTARHHTFFEMLGNFSFGDYFKELAIELAWNLLTKEFGLPNDKLSFTVYHTDDEAFNLWKKITGCDDSRILRVPTKDNFWAMGDTGPCGPCSEIFYDHGVGNGKWALDSTGQDMFDERFVEVWNLVFMQYEHVTPEERINLPKPSIDTGMGLERIATVLQGVHDNYDTDLFKTLIAAIAEKSRTKPEGDAYFSHRVIADHLRSCSFLIADGVMPSNEGRGYVLRRIMRRAMRHAHQLGCREPLMHKLVPDLTGLMGKAYPELVRGEALITELLKLEEERFKTMLDRGLKLLGDEIVSLGGGDTLSGEVAFKLYDTYGFPFDLTEDILRSKDKKVDEAGFKTAMEKQKAEARKAWSGSGDKATDRLWFDVRDRVGVTEFLGYTVEKAEGQVTAIVVDGKHADSVNAGKEFYFTANQTPFYGESGGQTGDSGHAAGEGFELEILDTEKPLPDVHVHKAKLLNGLLKVGANITLFVDVARREKIRANHSATHILHKVLRDALGDHVTQKGSLVSAERLRFDFSHPKALLDAEITAIEDEVNRVIRQNAETSTRLMTPDEAVKEGAMALFGEKYGDEVRVVSMGLAGDNYFSVELCGGTHVRKVGDIGLFKIVAETSVSAGVRRIEALTHKAAFDYLREQEQKVYNIAQNLKTSPAEVEARIAALVDEKKKLEREVADLRKSAALGGGSSASSGKDEFEDIGGIAFYGKVLEGVPAKDLPSIIDAKKKGVVALVAINEGRASLAVGVAKELTGKVSAVDLVKAGGELLGAKGGGGRPDMAQSGGPVIDKAADSVNAIREALRKLG